MTGIWLALAGGVLLTLLAVGFTARELMGWTPPALAKGEPVPRDLTQPTAAGRFWTKRSAIVAVCVVAAAGLIALGRFVAQQQGWIAAGHLDGVEMGDTIAAGLTKQLGVTVVVSCPSSVPRQKNKIVDCTAQRKGAPGSSNVTVTIIDLDGHFRYELNDPSAIISTG